MIPEGDLQVEVEACFAADYHRAKAQFDEAAKAAGARTSRIQCPAKGPHDESLSIDVAFLSAPEDRNLLVVTSGVHGVEGYAGSAVQVDMLRRRAGRRGVAMLLVHFVNPYGMAWTASSNEDDVDLNRNFIDFSVPPPVNALYDEVDSFISCPAFDGPERLRADAEMASYIERRGFDAFAHAVSDGQYHRPGRYNFGGAEPAWSNRALRAILHEHAGRFDRIGVIDVHTGLGNRGDAVMLCITPPDAAAAARAGTWWSNSVAVPGPDFPFAPRGTFAGAVWTMGLEAEITAAALEVGTEPPERAFAALRNRHWLAHARDASPEARAFIESEMHECLAPPDTAWRAAMLQGGRIAVEEALTALETR